MFEPPLNYDVACVHCGYNLRGLAPTHRCPECSYPIKASVEVATRANVKASGRVKSRALVLNGFEKLCAVLAFAFGMIFLLLGIVGLFVGCSAHFTLPPILGVLPALVGWGILRSVRVAMRAGNSDPQPTPPARRPVAPMVYHDPVPTTVDDLDAEIDRHGPIDQADQR